MLRAACDHMILGKDVGHREIRQGLQPGVERREIGIERRVQQLIEAVDHEIGLLIIVDPIADFILSQPATVVSAE